MVWCGVIKRGQKGGEVEGRRRKNTAKRATRNAENTRRRSSESKKARKSDSAPNSNILHSFLNRRESSSICLSISCERCWASRSCDETQLPIVALQVGRCLCAAVRGAVGGGGRCGCVCPCERAGRRGEKT